MVLYSLDPNLILSLLGSSAIGGSVVAIVTSVLNHKKDKADVTKTTIETMQISQNAMREALEETRAELKDTKTELKELKVQLNSIMDWIVKDNAAYRTWCENKIREFDPNIIFPTCPPCPYTTDVE